jgi:hypothetical protein
MRTPLFGLGQQGKSPNVTAQTRVNMYLQIETVPDGTQIAAYGTPGTLLRGSFGDTPIRGSVAVGDLKYDVHRGNFWSVNNAGVKTVIGTLSTTTGKVGVASSGSQIMIVDGQFGYIYSLVPLTAAPVAISSITRSGSQATLTTAAPHGLVSGNIMVLAGVTPAGFNGSYTVTVISPTVVTFTMDADPGGNATVMGTYALTTFAQITAAGYVPADTVTWQDQYFIQASAASKRFQICALTDGMRWDPLDFSSADSTAGNIVRTFADHGELIHAKTDAWEFWGDSSAQDFPYKRLGSAVLMWGLAARWSMCKFRDTVMALVRPQGGGVQVGMLTGYTMQVVSTPNLDAVIKTYPAVEDATAFHYMLDGHPMYQVNFPSAPNGGASWLYDGLTNAWSQVRTGLVGRHLGELGVLWLGNMIVSDYSSGNFYQLDENTFTDNGAPIYAEIISQHYKGEEWISFVQMWVDIESGVGLPTGQGSDPKVMIAVSKDGGHNWGYERTMTMGKIGQYKGKRCMLNRFGRARDWTFRLRISDPVKRVLLGAFLK